MRANGCIDDRGAGCFSAPGFLEILFLKIQGSDSAKLQLETESRTFLFFFAEATLAATARSWLTVGTQCSVRQP